MVWVKNTKIWTIGDQTGIKGWPKTTPKTGECLWKTGAAALKQGQQADFHPNGVEFQPKHKCEALGQKFDT